MPEPTWSAHAYLLFVCDETRIVEVGIYSNLTLLHGRYCLTPLGTWGTLAAPTFEEAKAGVRAQLALAMHRYSGRLRVALEQLVLTGEPQVVGE